MASKSLTYYGKLFEQKFKESVPDYCMIHRLKDSAQSFKKNNDMKFSWDNPCDFFIFNSKSHILYCLELKSTKQKYISYDRDDDINECNTKHMIQSHQIKSLKELSKYDGIISGLILNFRDLENDMERTYFLNIKDFLNIYNTSNKHSLNELDLLTNNAIKINGTKLRKYYKWNIDEFLAKAEV